MTLISGYQTIFLKTYNYVYTCGTYTGSFIKLYTLFRAAKNKLQNKIRVFLFLYKALIICFFSCSPKLNAFIVKLCASIQKMCRCIENLFLELLKLQTFSFKPVSLGATNTFSTNLYYLLSYMYAYEWQFFKIQTVPKEFY
jgi:hypothetical protein